MENEVEKIIGKPPRQFANINIAAAILMAAIVLTFLGLKQFFPNIYSRVKECYITYFMDETTVEDVINGVNAYEL